MPVVNENDTIATAEIRFGDNDRLAARVAQMMSADMLVLLSDIDGLYTADPRNDPDARHIPLVREIGPEIEAMAGEAPPGYSSGGMVTKLAAARIAMSAGCRMVIAKGDAGRARTARGDRGRRAGDLVPAARRAALGAQGVDRRRGQSGGRGRSSTTARPRRCGAARACCRPASSRSRAPSSAATR